MRGLVDAAAAGVAADDTALSRSLLEFVRRSPTAYHAVAVLRERLDAAGFSFLSETAAWDVARGGSYYTVRNDSSLVAWRVGEDVGADNGKGEGAGGGKDIGAPRFGVVAAHTDSPMLRVKANHALEGPGPYLRLDVEVYGGAIDRTWLDRPLALAGRAMVREEGRVTGRLFCTERAVAMVPSLAIHLNRAVNREGGIDRRCDLMPLVSAGSCGPGCVDEAIAQELGVSPSQVIARDLFAVNLQEPVVWGLGGEFVSAPRLDDLQCAFAGLEAFAGACAEGAADEGAVAVLACFDNEEVGSGTMQGALGTLLPDVLRRVCEALVPGGGEQAYARAVARSFMVSCDNAQAVHPNHAELYDEANRAWLNGGVVVKETANQKYATDALSRAVFEETCRRAGVPVQRFANRSDMAGGSTLGNLATRQVGLRTVDVGLPQLAMHSAFETAGVRDTGYLVRALRAFYAACPEVASDGSVLLAR